MKKILFRHIRYNVNYPKADAPLEIAQCIEYYANNDGISYDEEVNTRALTTALNCVEILKIMSELLTEEQKEDLANKLNFKRVYDEGQDHDDD